MVDRVGDVQLVEKRVAILRDRSSEDHDLVDFTDTLEECVNTWALNDVDVVVLALDFNRDSKVGLVQDLRDVFFSMRIEGSWKRCQTYLETAVDQGLIQIKNQALLAAKLRCYRRQQPLLGGFRS